MPQEGKNIFFPALKHPSSRLTHQSFPFIVGGYEQVNHRRLRLLGAIQKTLRVPKIAQNIILFFSCVHATLQHALYVCASVGWSASWSHYSFFYNIFSFTSLLLPKWSSDLKYGPCLPTCDFGSRVSGLVSFLPHSIVTVACKSLQRSHGKDAGR